MQSIIRIQRIFPAYLFMLAIVMLVASWLFISQDFNSFVDSLKNAILFNSNSYFSAFGDYFAPATHEQPLLHTWSLAHGSMEYAHLSQTPIQHHQRSYSLA